MAILNSNLAVGIGAAVAATILAPVLLPVVSSIGRPLAKSLIKGGMLLYEKSREAVALAGEATEDLIAEIRSETAAARDAAGPSPEVCEPGAAQAASAAPPPREQGRPQSEPGPEAGSEAGRGEPQPERVMARTGNGAAAL